MEVIEALLTRRSIRRYLDQPVSDEHIATILKAGLAAPSAHNRRPYQFVVVKDKEVKLALGKTTIYGKMLPEAPVIIVVLGNTEVQKHHDLLLNDCSAATENILLAVHGLGLGAVWVGILNHFGMVNLVSKALKLPEHILPIAMIPIGYPNEVRPERNQDDTDKIHYDQFRQK